VPITNYGLALAAANGMEADGASRMIRRRASAEESRCGREKGTDE
jgi:hypothetical protein